MTRAKRNIRILATVVAMVLVTIMMSIGIYAAAQGSVSNTGTITFEAKDVFASVSVSKQRNEETATELDKVTFNSTTAPGEATTSDVITMGDFAFTNAADVWKIVVTITNDFTVADGAAISVNHIVPSVTNEEYANYVVFNKTVSPELTDRLLTAEEKTGTVTFEITLNQNADGVQSGIQGIDFGFDVTLDRSTVVAS